MYYVITVNSAEEEEHRVLLTTSATNARFEKDMAMLRKWNSDDFDGEFCQDTTDDIQDNYFGDYDLIAQHTTKIMHFIKDKQLMNINLPMSDCPKFDHIYISKRKDLAETHLKNLVFNLYVNDNWNMWG